MIDLVRLNHAVVVAREGTYGAAAAVIPLSQSALTRSVQTLEREYGIQIFERGRFGARLTEQGAEFIRMAEDVLQRSRVDAEALKLLGQGGDRHVRFCMGSIAAALLLPRLLPELEVLGARYQIAVESNSTMRSLLRSGQIDFFIGGIPRGSDGFASAHQFAASKIPGGKLGLLVREGHPLLQGRDGRPLSSFPVAAGTFIRDLDAEHLFEGEAFHGPVIEMDNYDLLAKLAQVSDFVLIGSTVLPAVRPDLGLIMVPGSELQDVPLDWGLVRAAGRRLSDSATRITQSLFALMSEVMSAESEPEHTH
ncbi:LysR family transcriptional regulator [Streptomyces sp. NPDC047042]|uniref:LysR family transcriptional regulator n=1 Tax=Streptomyces sp. NPDC047042 TaxID=3154807 RepID=UPI0033EB53F4